MTIWPPDAAELKRPAYRSLAQAAIDAIEAGEFRPGAKLPTHRSLAFDLGLSVQTVSRAYDELRRLGFVSGEVGRGTYVHSAPTDARMPWQRPSLEDGVIDCSMLIPVTGQIHSDRMASTLAELAESAPPSAFFSFRPRAALEAHCESAVGWLESCGLTTQSERIVPTNGNTSAMTVALMTCALPGDLVVTEAIGHHTLKSLTNSLGLRLSGLAIDDQGIIPEAFEKACRSTSVRVLFLLPGGLGPTAAVMGPERRRAIVQIAERHDVWIIESDAWGPLQPDRPSPIVEIAPERTFYFTGFTKCVLPGLRIAWLVVPEQMIAAARTRQLVTNWMATPLIAEIVTRWLNDGTAKELLMWQRAQLARRNQIASEVLKDIAHYGTSHGMHIWLPLSKDWDEDAFVAHVRQNGVAVAAGANFIVGDSPVPQAVRVCLGFGSETDIAKGLSVVSRIWRSEPEPALLAI